MKIENGKLKIINGGVCAPQGFQASGIHVGVKTRNKNKKDIALIVSDCECNAAAVYTKNIVRAAPLLITQKNLENGKAKAVFVNSGNANACAPKGEENAQKMAKAIEKAFADAKSIARAHEESVDIDSSKIAGIKESDVIVASTGVIGQTLPIEVIEGGVAELIGKLTDTPEGSQDAADAIMTTDVTRKEFAVEFEIGGKTLKIGGIAKGSGMIHPNMGTMLAFLTTDCAVSSEMIQKALSQATKLSFNRVSVDGDTSTNDMLTLMANGLGGNEEILQPGEDFDIFCNALYTVCVELAKMMASDGEGATHLITCTVINAQDEDTAEALSKAIISSSLVKAAMFGADANWGRVICAMGYSGSEFNPDKVNITFKSNAGSILVCENGQGLEFDEEIAKKILTEHDIEIEADIKNGTAQCQCWGCDLTYDYVKINGDYRT